MSKYTLLNDDINNDKIEDTLFDVDLIQMQTISNGSDSVAPSAPMIGTDCCVSGETFTKIIFKGVNFYVITDMDDVFYGQQIKNGINKK